MAARRSASSFAEVNDDERGRGARCAGSAEEADDLGDLARAEARVA